MAVWTNCFEQALIEIKDPITKVVISSVEVGGDVATIKCLEPLFRNVITAAGALAGVALFLILIALAYLIIKAIATITGIPGLETFKIFIQP
jgi:hypothetical protein